MSGGDGDRSEERSRVVAELSPDVRPIDLSVRRSIHVIGIGGAGMRAIARVLLEMGHGVSGSDRTESRHLAELRTLGATVYVGHDAAHLGGAELVTRSTAVADDNPEVRAALAAGVPVHARAEMLAAVTASKSAVLVAGTHGKTTTSSMLAVVLDRAGREPSFVIGSDVDRFGTGARWAAGVDMVVEADESDGTFLVLPGAHAIVTSLDPDHLEFYGTADRMHLAFEAFVAGIEGVVAICIDGSEAAELADRAGMVTYGSRPGADLSISDIAVGRSTTTFDVTWRGEPLGRAQVGLPGQHNALNAAGALTIALELGIPFATAADGLAAFTGVARRFEHRGDAAGVAFVDDYAHLPAEVEAAVAAARRGGWDRVIAAYQPHRYSRTQALGATFARSFRGVDHLVLTDIYPSGEQPRPGVTGRIVYDAVVAACPELDVSWQPSLDDVVAHLTTTLRPGDLCLTLGAGDLTTVPDRVMAALEVGAHRPAGSPSEAGTAPGLVRGDTLGWLRALAPRLHASEVSFDAALGALTTYRVGGPAAALVRVGGRDDLTEVVAGAARTGVPVLAIGRGSNLLVADTGFPGIAVMLVGSFEDVAISGVEVVAGAGAALPIVARLTVADGLAGFEWAVGVPGSVGGAVTMNAGGHGSDMAASTTAVTVLDLQSGAVTVRDRDAMRFGYRRSSITSTDLVLDATLRLERGDPASGEALIAEIVRWRRENQPGGHNAGSVFTNPPGDSAGRLIDATGLKGLRVGSAAVSVKHANFVQVDAGGTAADVIELMDLVAERVAAATGVRLEPETRLVGFDREHEQRGGIGR